MYAPRPSAAARPTAWSSSESPRTLDPVVIAEVSPDTLDKLREAGRIAAAARDAGARRIVAGAKVREVCVAVEDEIHRAGRVARLPRPVLPQPRGRALLPVAAGRERVRRRETWPSWTSASTWTAGWWTPRSPSTSVTARRTGRWCARRRRPCGPLSRPLAPGVEVRALSSAIQRAITSLGLRPVRNLCGHGVGRWTVHCPPPIPNVPDDGRGPPAPARGGGHRALRHRRTRAW